MSTPRPIPSPMPDGPAHADGRGNWLTTAPPRALIVVGVILVLGSCLLASLGTAAIRDSIGPLFFCAGPTGLLILLVGLARVISRRSTRRAKTSG